MDLVFISPWDNRVRVPPFENDSQNHVQVVLAERGDRALLESGPALVAIISKINEANSPKRIEEQGGENRQQEESERLILMARLGVLAKVSREYGLMPEEVDRAIREWGRKERDPFHVGLTALYARNYPEAAKQLSESLQARLTELERAQARAIDAAAFLGQALFEQGKYREAVTAYKKAAELRPSDGGILSNLGASLFYAGDYAESEAILRQALTVSEKNAGADSHEAALSLSNLADLYQAKGDYARAEVLLGRASAIVEKNFGAEHQHFAASLNRLAELYRVKGDYTRAKALLERALAIDEKILEPGHPDIARLLDNLAHLYKAQNDYERASALFQRTLELSEKAFGAEHPRIAIILNSIAELHRLRGDHNNAEALAQRALKLLEGTLGSSHPYVAQTLNNLGLTYRAKGDSGRAKSLLERAVSINEEAWGGEHPDIATILNNLAAIHRAEGDVNKALTLHARATEISERHLALVLAAGSEQQKRLYLATLANEADSVISLNTREARNEVQATRLAVTTVLRHKGRVLDTMAGSLAGIRQRLDPASRDLLNRLSIVRSELAMLILKGESESTSASRRAKVRELEAEADNLEAAISNSLARLGVYPQPLTLARIQEVIPEGAALVEIMAYKPFNPRARAENVAWGEARYVAYVLKKQGEPLWVDLGETNSINAAVVKYRLAVTAYESPIKPRARELDEMVMRPIRRLLGPTRHLLLSPDGALNLIPFGALVNEDGRFLLQDYTITYLTSGRDLLRMQTRLPSQQPPFILANPTFNPENAPPDGLARYAASHLSSMPGAYQEARYLHERTPGSTFITGVNATEKALKNVHSPSILHISTYSFFLPLPSSLSGGKYDSPEISSSPLLRSGLILAEAGERRGDEDGVVTALEAMLLDLRGTKLVVLSGCETGVGETQDGEGVYGFRRALVIAGSESQVISLWKVADISTRELIVGYYHRLLAGEGRTEALRQVQLSMLASAKWQHPFYWASFIQSGDWRSIDNRDLGIK